MGAERERLADLSWKAWGPYVSERAWGTVREDYSATGDAWGSFPHEQARSRAYRWSEDGLGAICDIRQRLCLGFAFWNGRDPILKERIFGLAGPEGNQRRGRQGALVVPGLHAHALLDALALRLPAGRVPLRAAGGRERAPRQAGAGVRVLDSGVLDQGHWEITVDYAKRGATNICARVMVRNAGPTEATLDVLPTLWYRNSWSWHGGPRPQLYAEDGAIAGEEMTLVGSGSPGLLFCENESNAPRLWGARATTPYPRTGSATTSSTASRRSTRAAWNEGRAALPADPSGGRERRVAAASRGRARRPRHRLGGRARGARSARTSSTPRCSPARTTRRRRSHARRSRACSGRSSSSTTTSSVARRRRGPAGAATRAAGGPQRRLAAPGEPGHRLDADKWEYPLVRGLGPRLPHGRARPRRRGVRQAPAAAALPRVVHAPERAAAPPTSGLRRLNPPVHAWAAMRVFELDGSRDYLFLARILHKLLLNFTWWVNRKDADGENVFEGGFLGLDNIGPLDRSAMLPVCGRLEQSDGTAWMAMYCLDLLDMSLALAKTRPELRGRGDEVLRAFRPDRAGDERQGPVG